jgi:hypothetical protein
MYLSQITKIATLAGTGPALFLLAINSLHDQPPPEETDIDKYIDKFRDKTELPLRTSPSTQDDGTCRNGSSAG